MCATDISPSARQSTRKLNHFSIGGLNARMQSLIEEHRQYEVEPLRQAYTEEITQRVGQLDNMIKHAQSRRAQAIHSRDWKMRQMLVEDVIPELTYHRQWLFDSVKQHRI